jgi:hypothetical protein
MSNLDVHTSGLLERPFLSHNFRSRVDRPSTNINRQDKVRLSGKRHIAKVAISLRMTRGGPRPWTRASMATPCRNRWPGTTCRPQGSLTVAARPP